MLKRWITALALLLSLALPAAAIDVIPGAGGSGASSGGAPSGLGTTSGTSTTGFGKQWFPSGVTGAVASGQQMVAFFLDDLNVAFLRRSTGCANCLQTGVSSDGGINVTFTSTSAIIGNSISTAHRVPSATPRFLVSSIGGPLNIFQSTSLSSGWTAVVGLANPISQWASNADGTTVLSYSTTGANVQICRSTDTGISFGNCNLWGAVAPAGGLAYAGGTNWLFTNNGGQVFRSSDDGLTFALVFTAGGNGRSIRCLSPTYTTCLYTANDGNLYRSTDAGLTFPTIPLSGLGTSSGQCDFGNGNSAAGLGVPPIGFGTIAQNVFSSFNAGIAWFAGQTNGSHWDGTGVPSLNSLDCRNGRGIATYATTGGGTNVFAVYNPLTQPGGVLTSSAGGYNISAPIQAGIILNAAPTTSAANTAAAVTLTNTSGSRVCIRSITLFASAAGAATLTITDGAVVIANYGTVVLGTSALNSSILGTPLIACSQTGQNLIVNIGAAGAGVTTTTSVIGDRYPN